MERKPRVVKPPKKEYGSPRQIAILVKHYPCLWDPAHPLYKVRTEQEKAWDAISHHLNGTLDAAECKEVWQTVRRMKRNYVLTKQKRSGMPAKRKPRDFKYAKETDFLDGVMIVDESQEGNLGTSSFRYSENQDEELMDMADEQDVDDLDDVYSQATQNATSESSDSDTDCESDLGHVGMTAMDFTMAEESENAFKREELAMNFMLKDPLRKPLQSIMVNSAFSTPKTVDMNLIMQPKFQSDLKGEIQSELKPLLKQGNKLKFKPGAEKENEVQFKQAVKLPPGQKIKTKTKYQLKLEAKEAKEKARDEMRRRIEEQVKAAKMEENIPIRQQRPLPKVPEQSMETLASRIIQELTPRDEEDSTSLFLLSLAPKIRRLPLPISNSLSIEIHQMVAKAEERSFSGDRNLSMSLDSTHDTSGSSSIHEISMRSNSIYDRSTSAGSIHEEGVMLCSDMKAQVNKVLASQDNEIVCQIGSNRVLGRDIKTLKPREWLNDTIIDSYMDLVSKHFVQKAVHALSCYFLHQLSAHGADGIKALQKTKVNLSTYELILMPVCENSHWYLVVADLTTKKVTAYDSFESNLHKHNLTLRMVALYLENQTSESWSTEHAENIPYQDNGYDCGVFTCMFARQLCSKSEVDFRQAQMPMIREAMVLEITSKKLLNIVDEKIGSPCI